MGDASEVVREVGIDDFRVASEQQPVHLDHRLLGISPRTVRVLFGWKVGFEDRLWHAGFPMFVVAYALLKDADPAKRLWQGSARAAILSSVAVPAAVLRAAAF